MLKIRGKIQPDPKGGWQCRQKKECLHAYSISKTRISPQFPHRGVARNANVSVGYLYKLFLQRATSWSQPLSVTSSKLFHEICQQRGRIIRCKRLRDCALQQLLSLERSLWPVFQKPIFAPAQIRMDIMLEHAKSGLGKSSHNKMVQRLIVTGSTDIASITTFTVRSMLILREERRLHGTAYAPERAFTTPTGITSEITSDKSTNQTVLLFTLWHQHQ